MSDSDLISELEQAPSYNFQGCKVCYHLAYMSDDAVAAVEAALSGTMGADKIAAALTKNGYPVSGDSVNRHRKGHKP